MISLCDVFVLCFALSDVERLFAKPTSCVVSHTFVSILVVLQVCALVKWNPFMAHSVSMNTHTFIIMP